MVEECNRLWNMIVVQQQNVRTYLYQLDVMGALSEVYHPGSNIKNVCNNALKYLEKHQESNGCWVDFCNNAGASDCWCTAFVTLMLEDYEPALELTEKAKDYLRVFAQKRV